MKLSTMPLLAFLIIPGAFAVETSAPPSPHALADGQHGSEDIPLTTIKEVQTMDDGATIALRGKLVAHQEGDKYTLQDKTGTMHVQIPLAAFHGRTVKPEHTIRIHGSLDKKMQPPVVRVSSVQ